MIRRLLNVALMCATALVPALCSAQAQHRVDLYGLYEGFTSAGHPGHGALVADWRVQAPQRRWATSLSLHSDTLAARGDVRLGDSRWFLEPELRGQTPTAGLAPDYMVRGERWASYGYSASYVAAAVGARGELGRHHTVRATLRGRRWFFGELGSTGDIALPTTEWVAEPRISYTWWNVRDDASIGSNRRASVTATAAPAPQPAMCRCSCRGWRTGQRCSAPARTRRTRSEPGHHRASGCRTVRRSAPGGS